MSKQYTLDGRSFTLDDGLSDDEAYNIIQNFLATEEDNVDTYGRSSVAEEEDAARKELEALYAEEPEIEEEVDEGGFFDQITPDFVEEGIKGTIGGAAGLVESGLLGAATVLPESAELAVRDVIQSAGDFGEKYIYGADKGSEDMVLRKFGEALGSFGGILGASIINPFLGAGLAVGAGAGEASERARAEGATAGERGLASLLGAGVGATELISPMRMIRMLKAGYGDEAAEGLLNQAGRVIREGGIEAGQEAGAAVLQNLIEKGIYNPEQEVLEGSGEQAAYGGAVGAFVQTFVELAVPKSRKDITATEDKRQTDMFPTTKEKLGVAPEKPFEEATEKTPEEIEADELEAARTDERQMALNLEEPVIPKAEAPEALETEKLAAAETDDKTTRLDAAETDDKTKKFVTQEKDIDPFAEEQQDLFAQEEKPAGEVVTEKPVDLTVENTKSFGDLTNKARAEATRINKRDGTKIKYGNVLADAELPLTKAEYDAEKAKLPVAETTPAPVETKEEYGDRYRKNFSRAVFLSANKKKKNLSDRLSKVQKGNDRGQYGVLNRQLDELMKNDKSIIDNGLQITNKLDEMDAFVKAREAGVTPKKPVDKVTTGVTPDEKLTAKEEEMIASGEANIQKTKDAEKELYKGITVKSKQQLGGRVTTVSDGKKDLYFVRNPDDDSFYRASADGMKMLNFDGKDFSKSGSTALPISDNKKDASDILARELKGAEPDVTPTSVARPESKTREKKLTGKTKRDAGPKDAVAKIGKTLGFTTKDVKERVKAQEEVARKKKTPKKEEVKTDTKPFKFRSMTEKEKEKVSPKFGATKKQIKEFIKNEVKVLNSFVLRRKTREQEKRFAEQEEEAGRVTPLKAKEEAKGLEFYTKEFPDQRVEDDFSQKDLGKVAQVLQDKYSETKLKYPDRDSSGKTSAYIYFLKQENPKDALDVIAHDIVFGNSQFRKTDDMTQAEKVYFNQLGYKTARQASKWIRTNLDSNTNKVFTAAINAEVTKLKEATEREKVGAIDQVAEARRVEEKAQRDREALLKARDKYYADKDADAEVSRIINKMYDTMTDEKGMLNEDYGSETWEAVNAISELSDELGTKFLAANPVGGLDLPANPIIKSLLKQGKLKEALRALQMTTKSDRIAQIAGGLSKVTGDTKVELVRFLSDDSGREVAGSFDPSTNTIKLNIETGLNPHTILHEMTHAATSATLANKSHPLTKQMTKLFESVKGSLDTAYGSQSVDEFVAETFSNPTFQRKLASIHPDGSPISTLQRFFNSVGNFVRRMLGMQSKPVESALNASDAIIEGMLAPAPEYRGNTKLLYLSTIDGVKKLMKGIGNKAKNMPKMDGKARKQFGIDAREFLRADIVEGAKGFLLQLMGSKGLAEVSQANGFGQLGYKLDEAIEKQRGEQNNSDQDVKNSLEKIISWAKNNKEQEVILDNIIYSSDYGATIHQVDPTLSVTQASQKYGKDSDKMAIWQTQREQWNRLNKEGKDMYVFMRDHYKKQYIKLKNVIFGEIDAAFSDIEYKKDMTQGQKDEAKAKAKEQAQKLKNEVFAKLFDNTVLDVYFPLTRQGKYKLTYSPKNPQNPREAFIVRMFDSNEEMKAVEKEVRQSGEYVNIETTDGDVKLETYERVTSGSFVKDVISTLKTNGVKEDVQTEIMRLFINTLPESSFAKSLQPRKGFEGYQGNAVAAFRSKAYGLGRQTARLKYASIIRSIEKEISDLPEPTAEPPKKFTTKTATDKFARLFKASFNKNKKELLERSRFARVGSDSKYEPLAKLANQIAFIYTIGTNPSSAAVNLSQIPLFVYPYLGASYGYNKAQSTLKRSAYIVTSSNLSIDKYYDIKRRKDKNGVEVSEFIVKKDVPAGFVKELEEMAPMIQKASELGLLSKSSLIAEAMGLDESGLQFEGGGLKKKAGRLLDRVAAGSAVFFNGAERFNRQVTLMSTYKLALEKLNDPNTKSFYDSVENKTLSKKELADLSTEQKRSLAVRESIFQTQQTNGGTVLESAPRISQQGIGRVAMMYKSFGLNMYFTMLRSTKLMLDGEADPEVRKTAFKQIIGIHGSAIFFAGVHGVPLYGAITALMDMFMYDDEEDDADTVVRKAIGEGWYKGAINAITGLDVANRVKLTDLVIQGNKFNTNPTAEEWAYEVLLGPAGSVGKRFIRGFKDMREGEVERGFESFMPAGVANAYKTTFGRYQREGGVYTRRGDPIYDDMSGYEMAAQALGFAPVGYTLNQEKNQIVKGIEKAVNTRKSKLLKQYYMARRFGEDPKELMEEIRKFNKRHPTTAISPDTILRSLMMHMKSSILMHNGVTLTPNLREVLKDSMSEYSN
jgi:hypothetical protein